MVQRTENDGGVNGGYKTSAPREYSARMGRHTSMDAIITATATATIARTIAPLANNRVNNAGGSIV